ncbi:MAG TPA: hypothetical protein VK836_02120 [Streptosporangiaceae bacterium]|nr:hypothetical protein [Streptosporangiaceae bacterium]
MPRDAHRPGRKTAPLGWIVDRIEQASEAVLTELQLLLEDDERYRELLARNDELLNLVDRCLQRHNAAILAVGFPSVVLKG